MESLSRSNRRGIRFMVLAMVSFIFNDAIVKYVSESLPAGQLIVIRGLMACALVLLVARFLGVKVKLAEIGERWVMIRAALEAIASFFYLYALFNIPLPNATAINLSSPLFIAILAMIFYKERVDAYRWLLIAIGFLGVILVIQPRASSFNAFALLTLLSTAMYAGRDLLTRKIPPGIPVIVVTLSTAIAVTALAGVVMTFQGWQPFSARQLGLLALAAACLAAGYFFMIQASRQGEFSVVAPFRYTGLLGALVLGYLVWGYVPNTLAWMGIALLVLAGALMLYREHRREKQVEMK
jgi:drug/metabolite transporter (DMT)-like permease